MGCLPGRWARGASIFAGAAASRVFVSCRVPTPGRQCPRRGGGQSPAGARTCQQCDPGLFFHWELLPPPLRRETEGGRKSPGALRCPQISQMLLLRGSISGATQTCKKETCAGNPAFWEGRSFIYPSVKCASGQVLGAQQSPRPTRSLLSWR